MKIILPTALALMFVLTNGPAFTYTPQHCVPTVSSTSTVATIC